MELTLKGKLPDASYFRRPALLILWLITLPSVLVATVGILVLAFGRETVDVVLGVLILCAVAALATGIVLTLFSVKRRADLSTLQTNFVSKVSHDLRTPLTSIRMFVETLRMGRIQDPAKVKECLDVLARETERLSEMIDRLLDWGRMESGRRVFQLEPTPVQEVIDRSVRAFAPQSLAGVELDVRVEPDLPDLIADADALSDTVLNLLHNAYKYGCRTGRSGPPEGGGRIELSARRFGRAGGVAISVRDFGPGVPHAERYQIFERFYRGSDPGIRAIEGTGLGLAMARHVVQAHHGWIQLDSEEGAGSTFTLFLPQVARDGEPVAHGGEAA